MKKITLCGSTRFRDLFQQATQDLSLRGHVVYSLAMFGRQLRDRDKDDSHPLVTDEDKLVLDALHMAKIANSDGILIVTDETGYIGESTRREIYFARIMGKSVSSMTWTAEITRLASETNFRDGSYACPPV